LPARIMCPKSSTSKNSPLGKELSLLGDGTTGLGVGVPTAENQ